MIFPDGTADAINITDGMITLPATALDQAGRIRAWVEILAAGTVAWHSELFYLDVGELPPISEAVEQQYPTAFQDTMAQTTENRRKAEAWAVGQRDGADVESTDEAYQNNAKYYSQQGAASAEAAAAGAAAAAEGEAAAAASAANAAASEAAAAASESNAAASELAAETSETEAAGSAAAALASETAAAGSAADAAGSALAAAGSAEDAAESAEAADASANAAAESAARVDLAVLDSEEEDVDLDLSDRMGNVLARFSGGHLRTKHFDSGELDAKFAAKQNTLTFDDAPTSGSNNPVKSGGVYTALAGKQNSLTFDSTPTSGSGNPVTSGGVHEALSEADAKIQEAPKCVTADADADLDLADPSGNVLARFSGGHIKTKNFDSSDIQTELDFDDAPTAGSDNPVKSGGIHTAIDGVVKVQGTQPSGSTNKIWIPDLHPTETQVPTYQEFESAMAGLPAVKDSTETVPDLDISDNFGNVLARFTGGHIKTKEFDSSELQNMLDDTIEAAINSAFIGNFLKGKKWAACGDSFTKGDFDHSPVTDYYITEGLYTGELKVYPYLIGNRTGMVIANEAVRGATLAYIDGTHHEFSAENGKYTQIPNDADYITLKFGINDATRSVPIGTISDTVNTTFYGAWNIVLEYLITHHPTAKIGIIVTNGSELAYVDATIAAAEKWGIPYLNEATGKDVPTLMRTNKSVPSIVKTTLLNTYAVNAAMNNTHPNAKAHEFESYIVETWLKSL